MTTATWVTMTLIVSFVWGGFAVALALAIRKEAGKADDPNTP
ncbi:MAG TPA: hypothetical protein VGA70_05190 [Longimicrobiales bacterium]